MPALSPFGTALEVLAFGNWDDCPHDFLKQTVFTVRQEVTAARNNPEHERKADAILVALTYLERPSTTTRRRLQKCLTAMTGNDPDIYHLQTIFADPIPKFT